MPCFFVTVSEIYGLRICEFELDDRRYQLRQSGQVVKIEPWVFVATAGHAYCLLRRYEEASAALTTVLIRDPYILFNRANLTLIYRELGQEEALTFETTYTKKQRYDSSASSAFASCRSAMSNPSVNQS
jgi:hypothetical protein